MGAWIETFRVGRILMRIQSHPVWVRGLKHVYLDTTYHR